MKQLTKLEKERLIRSLERFNKVFKIRLEDGDFSVFEKEFEMVRDAYRKILTDEFFIQLKPNEQRLIQSCLMRLRSIVKGTGEEGFVENILNSHIAKMGDNALVVT